MLNRFERLNSNKQVVYLLGLSEAIIKRLSNSPNFNAAKNALETCWEWAETKEHSADDIYNLLDDGTEETSLFMLMQDETEEVNELAFGCIVDAVSYTNWIAFQNEGLGYLPAPIENVDLSLVEQFLDGFYHITEANKILAERFMTLLEQNNVNEIIRNRAQIKENRVPGFFHN